MASFLLNDIEKILFFLVMKISYYGIGGFVFAKINHQQHLNNLKFSEIFIHGSLLFFIDHMEIPIFML